MDQAHPGSGLVIKSAHAFPPETDHHQFSSHRASPFVKRTRQVLKVITCVYALIWFIWSINDRCYHWVCMIVSQWCVCPAWHPYLYDMLAFCCSFPPQTEPVLICDRVQTICLPANDKQQWEETQWAFGGSFTGSVILHSQWHYRKRFLL